jgi:hypothetical protein
MPEHVYREGFDGFPGHAAAGALLSKHNSFVGAWDELEICSTEDASEWLLLPAQKAAEREELPQRVEGMIQAALQFAMVAVMADRERRQEDQEHETRVQRLKEGENSSGNDPVA